jgi:hypothetical protein
VLHVHPSCRRTLASVLKITLAVSLGRSTVWSADTAWATACGQQAAAALWLSVAGRARARRPTLSLVGMDPPWPDLAVRTAAALGTSDAVAFSVRVGRCAESENVPRIYFARHPRHQEFQ